MLTYQTMLYVIHFCIAFTSELITASITNFITYLILSQAFFKALKVLDLWKKIDKSKDRIINETELSAIVPSKCIVGLCVVLLC